MAYILVADDDCAVRAVLRHILERSGHRVWEACDGSHAAHMAIGQHFDLLIMDMVMTRTSGVQAAREVLAEKPSQRIVLMSGIVSTEDADFKRLATEVGVRGLLSKPFTRESVLEALNRLQVT